jgi:acetylornithine deacetylase
VLGPVKMTVSILQSGTQHNVVPDSCKFTVDIRLNECYTHQEVFDTIQENIKSEAKARSMRLKPSSTDMEHPFVVEYLKTGGEVFGSSTLSDQALLSVPSVKIGPGDSARSHTADEYIRLSEIEEAIEMFTKLLDNLEIL